MMLSDVVTKARRAEFSWNQRRGKKRRRCVENSTNDTFLHQSLPGECESCKLASLLKRCKDRAIAYRFLIVRENSLAIRSSLEQFARTTPSAVA